MLHIIKRHCNYSPQSAHKKRPDWFSHENCCNNFMHTLTLNKELYDISILFDGDISAHFLKDFNHPKATITQINGGTGAKSYLSMIEFVEKQNYADDDIIYFVEDDYLHVPGWADVLLHVFNTVDVDFVSLYDHPDKYFSPMYQNLQSTLIFDGKTHWRSTPSTCDTYACKFKTFKKYLDVHKMFTHLDQTNNPIDHYKFQELWKRGSNLITCIPAYCTHCEPNNLAPGRNWKEISSMEFEILSKKTMETRTDIINLFIEKYGYKKYLEIGVFDTSSNFDKIIIENKVGVDPANVKGGVQYNMTSDEFFKQNNENFDIIFIDGLHHSNQVYKDIINAINCLNDNGVIIMHDCNPTSQQMQMIPRESVDWTGDCWKAFVKFRRTHGENYEAFVINTDYGVGVIKKTDDIRRTSKLNDQCDLTYYNLVDNRREWLNLKTVDEFTKMSIVN